MAVFAVLEPPARPDGQPVDPDRVRFVRDGFSWGAFLFGPLWMIRHRLWLVLLCWVLVMAGFGVIYATISVPGGGRLLVSALIALLIGLESATLRRWTLLRSGWRDSGIVVADDLEAAEQRYFSGRAAAPAYDRPAYDDDRTGPALRLGAGGRGGVLGLFPLPGGGR
ncbi:DUF2628 domain-containing protein [Rhodoplanes roseus]|uniref:DUF2628 domain-containing protein n=1 Tax=Rhodoplanes roseus TaxID=29409 RepID=A0A327KTL3_9BRAD|nr:DUF2628 domain-containing protein [Rhodoplanes roseus]RAI42159.1 hypothetical protein CH341_20175 [Rhodoplanes roseus]